MKEKLLKLIGLELKSISTLEFHNPYVCCAAAADIKYCTKSYTNGKLLAKYGTILEEKEWGTYKMIQFTLKFPDGEPDIDVRTKMECTETETLFTRRLFRSNVYKTTRERKSTTFIRCGHVEVELTDTERDILFKDVTEAYNALLLFKKEKGEADTLKKIEQRITKHESIR